MGIKEKNCYVALDYNQEKTMSSTNLDIEKRYQLPDGSTVTINNERFMAPEILFDPSLYGMDCQGASKIVHQAVMSCKKDIQEELCSNILLSGGTTMLNGIGERLSKDLREMRVCNARVVAPPERKFSAWIGGSILSSLGNFQQEWITKDEYEEFGPTIVHRKCF
jgi:actin, other eukaryote